MLQFHKFLPAAALALALIPAASNAVAHSNLNEFAASSHQVAVNSKGRPAENQVAVNSKGRPSENQVAVNSKGRPGENQLAANSKGRPAEFAAA
jgi:hypothetical protein